MKYYAQSVDEFIDAARPNDRPGLRQLFESIHRDHYKRLDEPAPPLDGDTPVPSLLDKAPDHHRGNIERLLRRVTAGEIV